MLSCSIYHMLYTLVPIINLNYLFEGMYSLLCRCVTYPTLSRRRILRLLVSCVLGIIVLGYRYVGNYYLVIYYSTDIELGNKTYQSGVRNTDGLLAHRRASSPQTGYYPAHRRATSFEGEK